MMRDRRSWQTYIIGVGLLILGAAVATSGSALALGRVSPGSGMITFVAPAPSSTTTALYGLDVETGLRARLAAEAMLVDCAVWSPDGKTAALAAPGLAGTLPQTLDSAGELHFYQVPTNVFAWSADSRYLLLEMYLEQQLDVYLLDTASGELRNLTPDFDPIALQPIWTPDGRQIIFLSPGNLSLHAFTVGIDGDGLRRVASVSASYIELLGWRAESREAVLWAQSDGTSHFYTLNVDSHAVASLTETHVVSQASLSPDGRRLTFSDPLLNEEYSIYLLELDGEPLRRIYAASPPGGIGEMRWSPGGSQLAFVGFQWGSMTLEDEALYLFDITSGELRALTSVVDGLSPLVWSPDGRQIAFRSDSATDLEGELPGLVLNELYTVDVATGNLRRLTYGLGEATCFTWIP